MWKDKKEYKPQDDENIWCINIYANTSNPILCYYDAHFDFYYDLYTNHSFPLEITHWKKVKVPSIKELNQKDDI